MLKTYFAGKIGKNDWRHAIVPDLRGPDAWGDPEYGYTVPPLNFSTPAKLDGAHVADYVGPFFISCDHGCAHGRTTHGVSADEPTVPCGDYKSPSKKNVQTAAFRGIAACDWMFVWMCENFATAFGTHVEVGYAKALGKKIAYASVPSIKFDEHWFLTVGATDLGRFPDASEAWRQFLNMAINGVSPPTAKQLSYARSLLAAKKLPEPEGLISDRGVAGLVIAQHAVKRTPSKFKAR